MISSLASYLDFANHHANATTSDIEKLCADVITFGFNSAFVNPCHVVTAKKFLNGKARLGTAISFPLGQDELTIKINASLSAVKNGADELDIVPNLALLLEKKDTEYLDEMKQIVTSVKNLRKEVIVKFIIDTGYLDPLPDAKERLQIAAKLIRESGADFVKICSGLGLRGASLTDLALVKKAIGDTIKIKVAGGIDTYEEAIAFISGGADRIGTSKAKEIINK